jgi:hypothetical protein
LPRIPRPKEYVLKAIVQDEMSRVGRVVLRKSDYSSNIEAHHIANGHLQQLEAVASSAIPSESYERRHPDPTIPPDIRGLHQAENTASHQLTDRQWIEDLIFYCMYYLHNVSRPFMS